jgi:hypothetical protein
LSDKFLTKLGKLSSHHNFFFIVDEVLTCGRTGEFLMTNSMPDSFQSRVQYIATGKWIGMGLVLAGKDLHCGYGGDRGETTGTNYDEATKAIELFIGLIQNTFARRAMALNELHSTEKKAWGKGVFIFCNTVRTSPVQTDQLGFKGRYLPMLSDAPFVSGFESTTRHQLENNLVYNKDYICNQALTAVKFWIMKSKEVGTNKYGALLCLMTKDPHTEAKGKQAFATAVLKSCTKTLSKEA